jgi:hypothetical protein
MPASSVLQQMAEMVAPSHEVEVKNMAQPPPSLPNKAQGLLASSPSIIMNTHFTTHLFCSTVSKIVRGL